MEPILTALLLTTIAGLSTTIGSFVAFFLNKPGNKAISFIMGFSAGVMILISFVELLQQGINTNGMFGGTMFFLLGMGIMFLIDMGVSHYYEFEDDAFLEVDSELIYNHRHHGKSDSRYSSESGLKHGPKHGHHYRHERRSQSLQKNQLRKTSLLVTLGVFIHNFPEGMATFIGTLKEFELGLLIMIAIALHNIPEGIAVAATVSSSTDSKAKAFLWSSVSGISEPIGALAVGLFLFPFITNELLGAMLSVVGGFMVYISLDELLPMSRSLGKEHLSILGICAGMFVMSISLAIL